MTPHITQRPTTPAVSGKEANEMNTNPHKPIAMKALAIHALVIFAVGLAAFADGFVTGSSGSLDLWGGLLRFALINAATIMAAAVISVWMIGRYSSGRMAQNDNTPKREGEP
ncbi:MAG: hypothetical protein CUN48_13730 [Candidatus Thermofonsia Clade 3 bacterium]|uniref:Uncharacterized protein n=1 Tax=Candidatus Thermofonsia Clade 3 bacterium TaxID=2364212 RepID=A0A2M8Q9H9_9CHLR|nr:MAG: hypothetical protein CUN48_13730 [Candidatus Thermofonsia Clade 3 bacterium]